MSLYGVLRTGVSGMNAQSNKLGTVAENIQNASTAGYKRASTEFSSLILSSGSGAYNSGAVTTTVRYAISDQGPISYTTSGSDLAISGNGFFVVSDAAGTPYLTRAGNFVVDGPTGNLYNAAGFKLMGYNLANGDPSVSLNSLSGLEPVNISSMAMQARPSTAGTFTGNLPYDTDLPVVPAADRPGTAAGTTYTKKSSLVTYDNLGNQVKLDIYMTKVADADPLAVPPTSGQWEIAVFDSAATPTLPGTPIPGGTATLTFDNMGQLTGPSSLAFDIPNGSAGFTLDLKGMTQLAGNYDVKGTSDGNAPTAVKGAEFGSDGTVFVVYEDGTRIPAYKIPLADVPSPDNLTPRAGNVYEASIDSGGIQIGFAGQGGRGSIAVGALEQSNVDIGTELTAMIEAQTGYTANSKVFQTGSELLDVLMNLKR
ncbi:flagellar hook protein FlgE [Microvirga puerhi]|uniref:Flagellar hook protein FlgE n=1 Tax=Microvirga puerhi TaxID=2876078 RepID=A0ABS7VVY2_9HYPH|nr:flagellar hook protein FlgE [Microvirga puerhi]MBZ6079344.1 flagellar hook protein FlgE [Microvirga puerhi]